MRNQIQRELDRAEEYVLTLLFGDISNPRISNKLRFFMIAKGIDFDEFINEKIAIFEEFSQDFMTDEGYYDGDKLTKALKLQFSQLEGLNIPNIKPIDFFKMLDKLVGLEAIGQIIQTI